MKRILRLMALMMVVALVAAACGDDDDAEETTSTTAPPTTADTVATPDTTAAPGTDEPTTTTAPPTPPPADDGDPFRIAFVSPSAINDLAFSQSIFDAVSAIQDEMGGSQIEFVYTDGTFVVEDAAAAIRDYASEGYDLVIGHGSQYGGSLQEIAPDFPDVSFAWGTAGDTFGLPNVYAYEAASHEGGYVMGRMAAELSNSDNIGVVGPIETGDAKLYVDGFLNGVRDQNPAATHEASYIGSFSDVALGSEAAQSFISQGADVLSGTAQMVVGPIGVARDAGDVLWFGTQANQTQLAPEIVVASQVYKWEVILNDMVANIKSGVLGGQAYEINLANGGEVIEFNEDFNLPANVRQLADDTIAQIQSGALVVPREYNREVSEIRIAFVSPSAINDLAFSQSIFDAINAIESTMSGVQVELAYTDGTFVVEDAAAAIRDYANEGYDLVIAHGSQYGGSLQEIAPDFPNTSFAWGTAGDTFGLPNVYAYEAASNEGGYVMGRMAAVLSNSNNIGVVGPIETGDAKLYVDGFLAGVRAQNPDATVEASYIGSFSDVALGSEAAQSFISQGADVLSGTAQMVVGPIGVARDAGDVLWFGTQANQTQLAPEIVVASQVYKWEVILAEMITNIQAGSLGGESYVIDFANGGQVIELNPDFSLSDEAVNILNDTVAGIIDGSIVVPTE